MKGLFSSETVTHLGLGGKYPPILDGHLFIEKWEEKLKTQDGDASYKLKSKLAVILRNIRQFTGMILK